MPSKYINGQKLVSEHYCMSTCTLAQNAIDVYLIIFMNAFIILMYIYIIIIITPVAINSIKLLLAFIKHLIQK